MGVNYLQGEDRGIPSEIFQYPETEKRQAEKLRRLRRERNSVLWRRAMEEVRKACKRSSNLMPSIIEAVKARATLGELHSVFKESFGLWSFPLS